MLGSTVVKTSDAGSEIQSSVKNRDTDRSLSAGETTAENSLLEVDRTEALLLKETSPTINTAEAAIGDNVVDGDGTRALADPPKTATDLKARLGEENEKEIPYDDGHGETYERYRYLYDAGYLYDKIPMDVLYQTYVKKLDERAKNRVSKRDPGPTIAEGFIDYVRALEARIGLLESKVLESKEIELGGIIGPTNTSETAGFEDGINWSHISLKTRFFHSRTEIDQHGAYIAENAGKEGTFTSRIGSKDLIRVLFDWNEDMPQKSYQVLEEKVPRPKSIDILAISLLSEPIARFFHKRLDLDTDDTFMVRLAKPFRPLLRSLQPLRDQRAKLEEKFGTNSIRTPSLTISHSPPGEEEFIEEFDRPAALEHFRRLLRFIDEYLGKQIDLLGKIKAATEEKIAFENLWMLFKSGETIHSIFHEGGQLLQNDLDVDDSFRTKRRDTPQSYHIISTSGGVPYTKTFARKPKSIIIDLLDNGSFSQSVGTQLPTNQQGIANSERAKNIYIPLYVYCFYIDFDGSKYGMVPEIFIFKPHEGMVDVRSLDAIPLNYLVSPSKNIRMTPESLQAQTGEKSASAQARHTDVLVNRGKKFIDMTTVSHMTYDGLTVGESREEISSAVIVDFKMSFQEYKQQFPESAIPAFAPLTVFWYQIAKDHGPEFATNACCEEIGCTDISHIPDHYIVQQKRLRQKIESKVKVLLEEFEVEKTSAESLVKFKKFMEDNDLIKLLPGVVPAFALKNRKWIQAELDLLEPVIVEDGWKDLVLPDGHKEMVQAMVETHTRGSSPIGGRVRHNVSMDLVRGKGKGCIILLHGAPGVGKTSTAECVAAYTKRPLYPITCGDIGYLPETVETNMEKHFRLAHKWGCVLLLDEADVFLAKRNKDDVKRNGLVSVFLRILEYYSGILFLTTNRVGAIDDAFRSRLHLTLYYPKLNKRQTIAIWKTNLNRLEKINEERQKENRLLVEFDRAVILKWVKKNWETLSWNGRQIRNAFQTALALAEFKARAIDSSLATRPIVNVKQFKIIATASVQFNDYLQVTHGMDEEKTAKRDMLRTELAPENVKFKGFESSDDSDESDKESEKAADDDSDDGDDGSSEDESEDSRRDKKKKNVDKGKSKKVAESKSRSSKGEKSKDKKKK